MLGDFQQDLVNRTHAAHATEAKPSNVMMVSPTGSGKTVMLAQIIRDWNSHTCVMAHRQELVAQTALMLNRENIPHGVIAPKAVIDQIISLEHDMFGYSRYSARAGVRVAAVDTLNARRGKSADINDQWMRNVRLAVVDEGHHVLKDNKWGTALSDFPNAYGVFPTAHALRADGAALGRSADGLADHLVIGPSGRDLIRRGFLVDYRVKIPPSDIDFSEVPLTGTGDYSMPKLRAATHKSGRIVGDVVRSYLAFAPGALGLTFAVDVEAAKELANAYVAAGVPAEIITAETPISLRGRIMRLFRERKLLQLVSVDTLGEGTDVPTVEVVSMARKTASFQLYGQQCGRGLRPVIPEHLRNTWGGISDAERLAAIASGPKPKALLIDHVGNFLFHGPPDVARTYTLARSERERSSKKGTPVLTVCAECLSPYERVLIACPFCGATPVPAGRGTVQAVDGDLIELDPEVLARMRGEIAVVDGAPRMPIDADSAVRAAILRRHHDRAQAQQSLRQAMALWGGWQQHLGRSDREGHKRFYREFGTDVMTAQTLGAAAAAELEIKIRLHLDANNVSEVGA